MTVLVDAGVFCAQADRAANRHEVAIDALQTIFKGEYGQPYTSDYVFDEVVTLTLARTENHEKAVRIGQRIRGEGGFPSLIRLQYVTPPIFDDAVEVFERYDDQQLSFTDETTVALLRHHDIDSVLSFDDDFDGIIDRLDPATVAERNP